MRVQGNGVKDGGEGSWSFAMLPNIVDRETAVGLLRGAGDGHLALCSDGTPALYPIDYCMSDGEVAFRLSPGSLVTELRRGSPVALEVDRRNEHEAWSVIAWGIPRVVVEEEEIDRLDRLPWPWWIASPAYAYVVLEIDVVSGRRIGRGRASEFQPPRV